jgi:hypothetical protein
MLSVKLISSILTVMKLHIYENLNQLIGNLYIITLGYTIRWRWSNLSDVFFKEKGRHQKKRRGE